MNELMTTVPRAANNDELESIILCAVHLLSGQKYVFLPCNHHRSLQLWKPGGRRGPGGASCWDCEGPGDLLAYMADTLSLYKRSLIVQVYVFTKPEHDDICIINVEIYSFPKHI